MVLLCQPPNILLAITILPSLLLLRLGRMLGDLTMGTVACAAHPHAEDEPVWAGDDGSLEGDEADRLAYETGAAAAESGSSEWPTFGIVGETQAALYYTSFLVFTALLFKNTAAPARGLQAPLRKTGSAL